MSQGTPSSSASTEAPPAEAPAKKDNLWGGFDEEVESKKRRGATREEEIDTQDKVHLEVTKYLRANNLDRKKDPLEWWRVAGSELYPLLHRVAMKYLLIPATRDFINQSNYFEN